MKLLAYCTVDYDGSAYVNVCIDDGGVFEFPIATDIGFGDKYRSVNVANPYLVNEDFNPDDGRVNVDFGDFRYFLSAAERNTLKMFG